jgi:NAD(P)H-flavin reductase
VNSLNAYALTSMQITETVRELPGVFTFGFEPEGGFAFRPGQFNMLYAHGVGEVPISISGDPKDPSRLIHTIRAVGGVTRALERLDTGACLGVRGPYGSAWPLDEVRGRDVCFIAGGLGLAPLRPAILHVLEHRDAYGAISILCGARSPDALLFRDQLSHWRGRFDCRVEVTVDRAGRDWYGPVGVVTQLVSQSAFEADDAVFACGPEIMLRFVVRELVRRGVPHESIWVSLERSMKCGVGLCGHCQLGGSFVCKNGPVYRFDQVASWLGTREL